jgi:hypothetical protein
LLHFCGKQKILSCTLKTKSMRKLFLRSLISVCVGAVAVTAANAQQKWVRYRAPEFVERPGWSLGVNFGLSDLWGDVGTKSPIDHYVNDKYWDRPKFMGGIFARYAMHPAAVLHMGVNYGTLYANDNFNHTKAKSAASLEDDAFQRYARNLDIKDYVWEGSLMLEVNPRRFNLESKGAKKRMQPYIMFGIGGFHFRPTATYTPRGTDGRPNGQARQVNLYDLHLEGDNTNVNDSIKLALGFVAPKEYSLWQPMVPLGLGLRWDMGKQLCIGVEYVYRYTFTDYLDNVSTFYVDPRLFDVIHKDDPAKAAMAKDLYDKSWQIDKDYSHKANEIRGNPSVKDGYSTLSITFYYKVKSKRLPWWYQGE